MAKRKVRKSPKYETTLIKKQRAEIFSDLVALIEAEVGYHDGRTTRGRNNINVLADRADVSYSTIFNWVFGSTRNPHINTMIKVADALGYDIALRRKKGAKPKVVK